MSGDDGSDRSGKEGEPARWLAGWLAGWLVAVQQGNLLATSFHPELGSDTRWHRHFVAVVQAAAAAAAATEL